MEPYRGRRRPASAPAKQTGSISAVPATLRKAIAA
jgi:hypothetical protein